MPKKRILVTGACGYIASHTLVELIEHGYEVLCIDSHINSDDSCLEGVYQITGVRPVNCKLDLADKYATAHYFEHAGPIDGVIHFAALKAVGESVMIPLEYYANNLNSLMNVLEQIKCYQVPAFIFSSSCTVYGMTDVQPVTEESPILPTGSPYGRTKQFGEAIIQDSYSMEEKIQAVALRYFNPAGAHPSGYLGELPINPPLNLIPSITETAIGKRDRIIIHGNQYNTIDGTCLRDYIHVMDLASAHRKALEFVFEGKQNKAFESFNIGTGSGVSVQQAIQIFEAVNRVHVKQEIGPARAGDIPYIYADVTKAKKELEWTAAFTIEDIMKSAWIWEQKRSQKII